MLYPQNLANGCEQHETFKWSRCFGKKTSVHYDYRHTNGKLFSCIKDTLDLCIQARDAWLAENNFTMEKGE